MKRWAWLLVFPLLLVGGVTVKRGPGDGGSGGIPGLSWTTGNDATLGYLYSLDQFKALEQIRTRIWVDPFRGSDATGDGTYNAPWQSFYRIKDQCLQYSGQRCTAKGIDHSPVFGQMYTLDYDASTVDGGTFRPGETVSWTVPGAASGTVVGVDLDKAVVAVAPGTTLANEPYVGTIFTGAQTTLTASVTDYTDTVASQPDWVAAAAQITIATEIITATGHPYATGDGLFLIYEAVGDFVATGVTEGVTDVYICLTGGTLAAVNFQIALTAACAAAINLTAAGTGDIQLVPSNITSNAAGRIGTTGTVALRCPNEDRICTVFDSEEPAFPWIMDGDGKYPGGALSRIACEIWIGLCAAGTYNPAQGGLFLASFEVSGTPTGIDGGWLGLQNGIVQNFGTDCLTSGSGEPGKLISLNVRCQNIRNGAGDRSQLGAANPAFQAHNTLVGVNGGGGSEYGGIVIAINLGDSNNQAGSDQGSGSPINPNSSGTIRILTQGVIETRLISGDTQCAGAACHSSMVLPGADFVIVGPVELRQSGRIANGTAGEFTSTTSQAPIRNVFAKVLFNVTNAIVAPAGWTLPYFFTTGPQTSQGSVVSRSDSELSLYESTLRSAGAAGYFLGCRVQVGTVRVLWRDVLVEDFPTDSHVFSMSSCSGDPDYQGWYNTSMDLRGVWDTSDAPTDGADYLLNPNARSLGAVSTPDTALYDWANGCDAGGGCGQGYLDQGHPASFVQWFSTGSIDSGGPGVDGHQWGVPADSLYRVQSNQAAYNTGGPLYTIDMTSLYQPSDRTDTCVPADVMGAPLCKLQLDPTHVGAR